MKAIVEENDWNFTIEYTDKTVYVFASPHLDPFDQTLVALKAQMGTKHPILVTLNTKKNFELIVKHFKELAKFHNFLQVMVINPNSQTDMKWIIFPYTHSRIADPETLELGLKAMFDTVDVVLPDQEKEFL